MNCDTTCFYDPILLQQKAAVSAISRPATWKLWLFNPEAGTSYKAYDDRIAVAFLTASSGLEIETKWTTAHGLHYEICSSCILQPAMSSPESSNQRRRVDLWHAEWITKESLKRSRGWRLQTELIYSRHHADLGAWRMF